MVKVTLVPTLPRILLTTASMLRPWVDREFTAAMISCGSSPAFSAGKPLIGEIITMLFLSSEPSWAPMPVMVPDSSLSNVLASVGLK
jgi:hypothetical protein